MRLSVASLYFLPLATLLLSCTDEAVAPPIEVDLLMNGSFELGSDGTPTGWLPTVNPDTEDHVDLTWTDGDSHSGERSVSIAIRGDHPVDAGLFAYNWRQDVNDGFTVGESYQLSVWVKAEQLSETAWITVIFENSEQQNIDAATTQFAHIIVGTVDWTHITGSFTIPSGTAQMVVRAGIAAPSNAGGTVWFDDLAITRVDGG